jgi:hypothetical protein
MVEVDEPTVTRISITYSKARRDEMKLFIHPSRRPSRHPSRHSSMARRRQSCGNWSHSVAHLHKAWPRDLRKIYPNVYVIQSTFQVCSYFVYTECSNNVQRLTTCEPKLQTNKVFLGSLCGKMATASWILCCLICTTITDCRVLAQLSWLFCTFSPCAFPRILKRIVLVASAAVVLVVE